VIGSIATTGDTGEVNDLCIIAGIRRAGSRPTPDFPDADMRRLNIKRGAPVEDPEKAAKPPRGCDLRAAHKVLSML
jgi:hypothetical protein